MVKTSSLAPLKTMPTTATMRSESGGGETAAVRLLGATNVEDDLLPVLRDTGSPYVALDTGFPGFIHHTPRSACPHQRYRDVKRNVDRLELAQVGLTFFGGGRPPTTWQINFREDSRKKVGQSPPPPKNRSRRRKGADDATGQLLSALLRRTGWAGEAAALRRPRWVTFHGIYDVAYLVKLLTGGFPLPDTLPEFARLVGETLATVYDVKYMARFCRGLRGGELSLARLSEMLEVEVDHSATHKSGYDSLLTAMAFERVMDRLRNRLPEDFFEGVLYGVEVENIKPPWKQPAASAVARPLMMMPTVAQLVPPPPFGLCRLPPPPPTIFGILSPVNPMWVTFTC